MVDRIYHWVMAISILTLMATAFLPILGWKFEWLAIHWVTGLVLTVAVMFHIIRSLFFQKIMIMVPDGKDVSDSAGPARQIQYRAETLSRGGRGADPVRHRLRPSDAAPH